MPTRAMTTLFAIALLLVAGCTGRNASEPGEPVPEGIGSWSWSTLAAAPTPRTEVSSVILDGHLYVIGGFGQGALPSAAVESLDLATGEWRARAPLVVPVHHAPAIVHDGRIHVLGGYASAAFIPTRLHQVYEPAADSWTLGPELPRARGAHGIGVVDSEAVLVGGVGEAGTLLATVDVLDVATGQWRQAADLPTPRDHLAVAAVHGRVHAVGGREQSLSSNTGTHEALDPATGGWRTLADLPTARGGIGAATLGDLLFVVGGEENAGTFDEVEAYDPTSDQWTTLPPLPTARHGLGVAAHDGALYAAAGGTEPGLTVSGVVERLERDD